MLQDVDQQKSSLSSLKKAKSAQKNRDPNLETVAVNRHALVSVCKLLALLSRRHGIVLIDADSDLTDEEIQKIIRQNIAEVLHAEQK